MALWPVGVKPAGNPRYWSCLVNPELVKRIEDYLKRVMNPGVSLQPRPRVNDSVEVVLNGEHIAVVYVIEDEGETSYQLQMTILQEDLDDQGE